MYPQSENQLIIDSALKARKKQKATKQSGKEYDDKIIYLVLCRVITKSFASEAPSTGQAPKIGENADEDDQKYVQYMLKNAAVFEQSKQRYKVQDTEFLIYPEYLMVCRLKLSHQTFEKAETTALK